MELLNPEYRQIVEGNKGTCGMNNFAHLGSPWSGGWVQRTFLKQKFNKTYPNINTTYVFVFVYLFDKTNINNSVENKKKTTQSFYPTCAILAQELCSLYILFPAHPTLGASHPRFYYRRLLLYGGLEARSHLSPSVPCTVGWYHDFDQPIEYPITQNKETQTVSFVLALA